jgi:DNA-binding NtrC family response regulator
MQNSSNNVVTYNDAQKPKRTVLIVDDEPDITLALKMGLESKGFQVSTFNDPKEALSNFVPNFYSILLSDIKMPYMNGFELYQQIRKLDGKIKVCFITAFEIYQDEFKRLFPKIDVRCFARKPVSIDELSKIIKEELEYSA